MLNLSVSKVSLSYGRYKVLRGISLDFEKPGVVGIIGPNGAGKSTLLRCINNILTPQSGKICLDGCEIRGMDPVVIARNFGYVPQEFPVTFLSTVFETVLMGRRPFTSWRIGENDMKIAADALRMMDLENVSLRSLAELSGGQQQRVMIARAIAQQSRIMLLDEPTSKLDIRHQLEVMDIIRNLADEEGLLSIIVMHDLNLASRYTDRIVMLKDGMVVSSGKPQDVMTKENIREVYGVEADVEFNGGLPYVVPKKPL